MVSRFVSTKIIGVKFYSFDTKSRKFIVSVRMCTSFVVSVAVLRSRDQRSGNGKVQSINIVCYIEDKNTLETFLSNVQDKQKPRDRGLNPVQSQIPPGLYFCETRSQIRKVSDNGQCSQSDCDSSGFKVQNLYVPCHSKDHKVPVC